MQGNICTLSETTMNGTFSTLTLMNLVWKCFFANVYGQVVRVTRSNYLQMSVNDLASSKVFVEKVYDYSRTGSMGKSRRVNEKTNTW